MEACLDRGIGHIASVPCSITDTWHWLAAQAHKRGELRLTMTNHEANLAGIAAGSYLATGRPALVHMQNSGLTNAADGFVSCLSPRIYGIPACVLITFRGATSREDSEPHQEIGDRTEALVQTVFGDGARIFGCRRGTGLQRAVECALDTSLAGGIGVVKLAAEGMSRTASPQLPDRPAAHCMFDEEQVRALHGAPSRPSTLAGAGGLRRDDAIRAIAAAHPGAAILYSNGFTSRAARALVDSPGSFYNVGYMGGTLAIGWALASERPDLDVVVVDGDQNALMSCMKDHLWSRYPPNLHWYILNNRIGASVGTAASVPLGGVYHSLARVVETVPDEPGRFTHPRVSAHGARFETPPRGDDLGTLSSLADRFRRWIASQPIGAIDAD